MSAGDSQKGAEHRQISVGSPNANFHSVLLNVIDSTKEDPAYARSLVYELARIKLTKEAWRNSSLSHSELRTYLKALNTAIDDVEAVSAREEQIRALLLEYRARTAEPKQAEVVEILEPVPNWIDRPAEAAATSVQVVTPRKSNWPEVAPMLRLVGVAVIVVGCLAGAVRLEVFPFANSEAVSETLRSRSVVRPPDKNVAKENVVERPVEASAARAPSIPLPTSFGVYALSGGHLSQLDTLPGRVPDQRIAVGPMINKAAQVMLSDGNVSFIVYRRDLVANAPERVSVRVVARIARAMTFERGKPSTASLEATWAVRSKSYDFKVAPLSENQEMIIVRPESEDLSLPAGRYALVLKNQSYDFSIAGPITDPYHCLERVDALNGTIYSECKKL